MKRLFFTHSASEPNNLLNRQTRITANCLMAMVSSGDLGDLPLNQTLPESDSGMVTLLSEAELGTILVLKTGLFVAGSAPLCIAE